MAHNQRTCMALMVCQAFLWTPTFAFAQEANWQGTISSDWFTDSNWSTGQTPTSVDTALIGTDVPNSATIDGANAVAGGILVGAAFDQQNNIQAGTGTLTIRNGGSLVSGGLSFVGPDVIGATPGSQGTMLVTGVNSRWTANYIVLVGFSQGVGTLNIQNRAVVDIATVLGIGIGDQTPGGSGTLTVMSGGSLVSNSSNASLQGSGGPANDVGAVIGGDGSMGNATVSGIGSTWRVNGRFFLGGLPDLQVTPGDGTLTVAAGGAVTAVGDTTLAPDIGSSGTLNIGASSGSAAVAPGSFTTPNLVFGSGTGTINFNHTATGYAFATVISGNGSIDVRGGTTALTGNDSGFTGLTSVYGGTLSADGVLGGQLAVLPSGKLQGIGTVGQTIVAGTIAPGHSIGMLSVNGNLTLAPGSAYQIEVNAAGLSDRIDVSGAAIIQGGNAAVLAQPGVYAPMTIYTVLNAAGGVSGQFASVSSNFAFLVPSLSYSAQQVRLTLRRNSLGFATFAQTPNQFAAATAIDAGGLGSLFDAVAVQTAQGASAAFSALSGDMLASVPSVLLQQAGTVRDSILQRLSQGADIGSEAVTALRSDGERIRYASLIQAGNTSDAPFLPVTDRAIVVWAQPFGGWGSLGSDGNAATVHHDIAGFMSGFDVTKDYWRIGVAGGYTRTSFDVDAPSSSGHSISGHAAIYGSLRLGALGNGTVSVRSSGVLSWGNIQTNRRIFFPGFADATAATFDSHSRQIFGEFVYAMPLGCVALEPFAGLTYVHVETDGFSETGGTAALSSAENDMNARYSMLGARGRVAVALDNGLTLEPYGSLAWQHAFDDLAPHASLTFQSTGQGFNVSGVPLVRNAALVEAGLDLSISAQIKLGIAYTGTLANRVHDHAIRGSLAWHF